MARSSSRKTGGGRLMSFAIGVILGVVFGIFYLALLSRDEEQ